MGFSVTLINAISETVLEVCEELERGADDSGFLLAKADMLIKMMDRVLKSPYHLLNDSEYSTLEVLREFLESRMNLNVVIKEL
jgi:hypothetical protein